MRLEGSTAVVTGGSRVDRQSRGARTRAAWGRRGGGGTHGRRARPDRAQVGATPITADLSDPDAIDRVVDTANDILGRIDILINNVALVRPSGVPQMTDVALVAEMQCNLLAPMRVVHRVRPMIDRHRGHIVNVSSGCGRRAPGEHEQLLRLEGGALALLGVAPREVSAPRHRRHRRRARDCPRTQAYEAALADEKLRRLYRRLKAVGLMADTTAEEVAQRLAIALERNKPYVRVPRIAGVGWALNSIVRDSNLLPVPSTLLMPRQTAWHASTAGDGGGQARASPLLVFLVAWDGGAGLFEIVRDAFEGFVAGVGGRRNIYVHSRGLKVWFDDDSREHYESQLIRVDGEVQLEIGFHAEHPKAPQNDEVLRRLLAVEPVWRPELGDDAVAGRLHRPLPVGAASPRSGRHPTPKSSTRRSRPPLASPTTSSRWSPSAAPDP